MSGSKDARPALIEARLARLVKRAGARTAAAITKDGRAVLSSGETDYLDTGALAALAASSFSTARETAAVLGEEDFSTIIQEGAKRHLLLSILDSDVMLAVVFEEMAALGRIRMEARNLAKELAPSILEEARGPEREEGDRGEDVAVLKRFARDLIAEMYKD